MKRHAVYFLLFIVPPLAIVLAWLGLETLSTNRLGWALLLTGIVCSVGIIIAAIIRRRVFFNARAQGSVVQEEPGDRSLRVMTVGMMAVFYLSPLEYIYLPARLHWNEAMEMAGVALFRCGVGLFIWARRTLGKAYSGHLSVQAICSWHWGLRPDTQACWGLPQRCLFCCLVRSTASRWRMLCWPGTLVNRLIDIDAS